MTMEYAGRVRVGLGVEEVLVEPVLHPPRLDGGGLEARGLLQVVGAAARVGHGPLSRSAPGRGAEGLRGGWFTRADPIHGPAGRGADVPAAADSRVYRAGAAPAERPARAVARDGCCRPSAQGARREEGRPSQREAALSGPA